MFADLPVSFELSSDICVINAAQAHGLPADLMLAVRAVERGMPESALLNKDGTQDFNEPGLNTKTMIELAKKGWNIQRLKSDGCYSMYAASFWMLQKITQVKHRDLPLLEKVSRYHSATPEHNKEYQRRLAPFLANWGCYLHVYWRHEPHELFVVQSGLLKPKDLHQCKRY